jgi:O-methyltransferase
MFWRFSAMSDMIRKIIKFFVPYGLVDCRRKILDKKRGWRSDLKISPLTAKKLGKDRQEFVFENEYIRASAVELIANEIYDKNITGSVAELGVYLGDFAKIINIAFPDRKLYLFDTFEGFDKRDIQVDLENKFSTGEQNFSGTSVELVLEKMQNRQNCIVKKGYFPETAKEINELFSFVSIDCDLYDPIYKGLHYFYENLNKGGYLLVHDYNNTDYNGVRVAVRKFSEEKNVSYFPLCDGCGSVALMKS